MPIYEYQCRQCGAVTEVTRSITEACTAPPCSRCSEETTRIISVPAKGIVK